MNVKTQKTIMLFCMGIFAASIFPEASFAQNLFDAPTTVLESVKSAVTGTFGVLAGGVIIAGVAVAAATPRSPVTWGIFLIVLLVLAIFYGAFAIAEFIQSVSP